jgi:hypothetical protein
MRLQAFHVSSLLSPFTLSFTFTFFFSLLFSLSCSLSISRLLQFGHAEDTSYSQCHQDEWVLSTFPPHHRGYFVDLAANHPTKLSNTKRLEERGWRGVCIEVLPDLVKQLREQRTCQVFDEVVADVEGRTVDFRFTSVSSRIIGVTKINLPHTEGNVKAFNTTTLESVLVRAGAPWVMDYLSLDIEGAEWDALKHFPFSHYVFLTMTIERPPMCLIDHLRANHYMAVAVNEGGCRFGDTWFVHATHPRWETLSTLQKPLTFHSSATNKKCTPM